MELYVLIVDFLGVVSDEFSRRLGEGRISR